MTPITDSEMNMTTTTEKCPQFELPLRKSHTHPSAANDGDWVDIGDGDDEGEGEEVEEDDPALDDLPAEHYQDVLRERLQVRDEPRQGGGQP